jgi:hypothetical protein
MRMYQFKFTNGESLVLWADNRADAIMQLQETIETSDKYIGEYEMFHIKKGEDFR